jgi:hypothetical protein
MDYIIHINLYTRQGRDLRSVPLRLFLRTDSFITGIELAKAHMSSRSPIGFAIIGFEATQRGGLEFNVIVPE